MARKHSGKWMRSIEELEKYCNERKENGAHIEWRISETPTRYRISAEEGIIGYEEIAYYNAKDWEEVVNFCSTHYNPGCDTLNGMGCTDEELYNATIDYIHSLGKKYLYD